MSVSPHGSSGQCAGVPHQYVGTSRLSPPRERIRSSNFWAVSAISRIVCRMCFCVFVGVSINERVPRKVQASETLPEYAPVCAGGSAHVGAPRAAVPRRGSPCVATPRMLAAFVSILPKCRSVPLLVLLGNRARGPGKRGTMRKRKIIRELRRIVATEGASDGRGGVVMGGDALDTIARYLNRADRSAWQRVRRGAR